MHAAASRRSLLLTAALLAAGCGADAPAGSEGAGRTWVELARGFEPKPLARVAAAWPSDRGEAAPTSTRVAADGTVWVETTIRRDEWHADEFGRAGAWFTPRPWTGAFGFAGDGRVRLFAGERVFERRPGHGEKLVPGLCYIDDAGIYITIEPGEEPPLETTYALSADQGASVDGVWRVRTLDHVGAGIPVHPGHSETVSLRIPPASSLRLYTVFERLPAGLDPESEGAPATATFRVKLDGEVVLEAAHVSTTRSHAIPLPVEGVDDARLTFEVEADEAELGVGGMGVFYAPVIGPTTVGEAYARPWGDERPNIVLFIADTFRADNMAIYGGRAELTPELNRFADDSLRFLQARSTASWTLPSIASILTGLLPPQHGAAQHDQTVASGVTTVAETLGAAGYRTAAVTDSGYFAPPFGLDQGFELFVENRIGLWNLTKTIDQALKVLDLDDGRPLFLVVHTYRVHGPFREGPDENQDVFDAFLEKCRVAINLRELGKEERRSEIMPYLDEWVGMYERGVVDMDHKFGRFQRELAQRRFFERGLLMFTGDHGQAHGENNDIAHGGKLWETKLRIPLLLYGLGIVPGDVDVPVSHVDWAPTFAELAGIPRRSDWVGASLFAPPSERALFAFRFDARDQTEVAVTENGHKISALPDPEAFRRGEVLEAFDLAHDPGELENLVGEDWARELALESADALERFLRAVAAPEDSELSEEQRAALGKIGYTDGGE